MPLLVASVAERIGLFVAAAMVVGWLVYVAVMAKRPEPDAPPGTEIELAPNRKPYYDDDTLEGPRLERALGWALVLLIISAVGPLVYWLNEPGRQSGAELAFASQAIDRGESLFQPTDSPEHGAHFGCATCHGSIGQGGATTYTITDFLGRTRQVTWQCPPLDTVALKFSDDELITILTYGRANTPMPAWGVEGGGPMNAQQITDLVAYMKSLTLPVQEARQRATEEILAQALQLGLSEDDALISGQAIFQANCARCHTKGFAFGEPEVPGGGAFGPSLIDGVAVRQFPDITDMIEFLAIGSEYAQPYGVRGVGGNEGGGMPGFGQILTPEQLRAVAEYVRGL